MLSTKSEDNNQFFNTVDLKDSESDDNQSSPGDYDRRKRDSGYGTDFSPASHTSNSRRFTFDSELDETDTELDVVYEFENMDIRAEVFAEGNEHGVSDDRDEADKEVEELLSGSGELGQSDSISQPVELNPCRPAAPIPTPEDFQEEHGDRNCDIPNNNHSEVMDYAISHSYHHMPWNRNRRKYYFRPISRSVGTQTPNPNCQIIREAIGVINGTTYQHYGFARGNAVSRLRSRSECEEGSIGQLPDIVPLQPERPHSLPDLVALREHYHQEMGRELRRIGDEFNTSLQRRRTASQGNPGSLIGYWNSFRRFLSPTTQINPTGQIK